MSSTLFSKISTSDAELVTASRNGNREAFGQIVRRYQSMVSGLIYAACGDLHRSEDIAQETFISAWKSLSGLRDAAKLPGWLCQIARHRIADHFREPATQRMQLAEELKHEDEIVSEPIDSTALEEESEILWRTLARIPQPYRETLVLYYRQGQSTAEVAAAMETTDAGVRQRLNRGRQMLREEMAAMLERNLARSAPGEEFSLAVMASLPMTVAQTATLGATAKGSAAAKSGFLLFLTSWVVPIAAVLSLGLITGQSIYRAEPTKRRRIIGHWILYWGVLVGWVFASYQLIVFGQHHHWDYPVFIPVLSAAWCLFAMMLFAMTAMNTSPSSIANPRGQAMMKNFWLRFVFLTPLIYLGVGWCATTALRAGDRGSAEIIFLAAIVGSAICSRPVKDLGKDAIRSLFESWVLMEIIALMAINLRMRAWAAVIDHAGAVYLPGQMPLWSVNVAGGVLFVWMLLIVRRWRRASLAGVRMF